MTSFEEDNLYDQMVSNFLESESVPVALLSSAPQNLNGKFYILQEILESGNFAEADVLNSVMKHVRKKTDASAMKKKWLINKLRMDGHSASLCHTTWPTTFKCPGGEYEYIEVISENQNSRVIVDTDFKSQFELARPTSTYKELSNILPSIFVGTEEKLNKIISIVCEEARHSFLERGLHVPPWRTTTYMHSKWFPSQKLS